VEEEEAAYASPKLNINTQACQPVAKAFLVSHPNVTDALRIFLIPAAERVKGRTL
ncbi:hypothetical protein AVEN_108763-1, partial [Araneus ventricosus]